MNSSVSFEMFSKDKLLQRMKTTSQEFGDAWWFVIRNFYPG